MTKEKISDYIRATILQRGLKHSYVREKAGLTYVRYMNVLKGRNYKANDLFKLLNTLNMEIYVKSKVPESTVC